MANWKPPQKLTVAMIGGLSGWFQPKLGNAKYAKNHPVLQIFAYRVVISPSVSHVFLLGNGPLA